MDINILRILRQDVGKQEARIRDIGCQKYNSWSEKLKALDKRMIQPKINMDVRQGHVSTFIPGMQGTKENSAKKAIN